MQVVNVFATKNPEEITVEAMLELLYTVRKQIGGDCKVINGYTEQEIEFLETEEVFLKNGEERHEYIVTFY